MANPVISQIAASVDQSSGGINVRVYLDAEIVIKGSIPILIFYAID